MIRATVGKVAKDLEKMAGKQLPVGLCFEILGKKAASVEEMVVVEVMKEAYFEMQTEPQRLAS